MGEINSRALIYIDFSGGNFLLTKVKTWDVDTDKETKVVTAATVADGAGFQDTPGGGSITLEVYRESPTPEVDWEELAASKERFTITTQDEDGGPREQYQRVRVSNVKRKGDNQGDHMMTVKLVYLRGPVKLPAKIIG